MIKSALGFLEILIFVSNVYQFLSYIDNGKMEAQTFDVNRPFFPDRMGEQI